jgi:hypothetical protein
VACDGQFSAVSALHKSNKPSIVLGPTTWDACARKMRQIGIPGW